MDFSQTAFKDIFRVRLNKSQISELEKIISDSKELFDELVSIIINGNKHEAFMASWVLQYAALRKPEWFYQYLPELLKSIENKPNESVQRCIARVLWKTILPDKHIGLIAQKCFEWLENKQGTITSKAFSIHILAKIIDHEPELCHEVKDITESILPYASAGMTNAAEKLLKKIRKMGY